MLHSTLPLSALPVPQIVSTEQSCMKILIKDETLGLRQFSKKFPVTKISTSLGFERQTATCSLKEIQSSYCLWKCHGPS